MIMSALVDPNNGSVNKPILSMILDSGVIFALYETREDLAPSYDFSNPGEVAGETRQEIEWAYETGYTPNNECEVNTFHALGIKAALKRYEASTGDRTITVTVVPLDASTPVTPSNTITVETRPSKMYNLLLGDYIAEKIRAKLSGKNAVFLSKLVIFGSEKAKLRPRA